MREFRIIASRIRRPRPTWMNRRYNSADYGVWRFAQAVDRSCRGQEIPMKIWLSLRAALAWSLLASSLLALVQPAHAEKRVALVIGNNEYKNVPKLQKAVNDARTMGDTLRQLGFSVMVAENQTRQAFSQTLLAFDNAIEPGDTAFFFYAGHGFEIAGQNFLLPTDVPAAGAGRTGTRRVDPGRPHYRAAAEQEGAHLHPCVRCLPQQSVRTVRHPRRRRRRWPRADDAIAGGRVLGVFRRPPPDRARSSVQQRRESEFGVHANLCQRAHAARRQPRSSRAAHAPAGSRDGGDRKPQTDPGLFRSDGRRRVFEWRGGEGPA